MKSKTISLLLMLLLSCVYVQAAVSQDNKAPIISGTIVDGLRLLTLQPGDNNEFIIYHPNRNSCYRTFPWNI